MSTIFHVIGLGALAINKYFLVNAGMVAGGT